jgi:hypothetical protein
MSREPSSSQQRYSQQHGGWTSPQPTPEPTPLPRIQRRRNFKVVVEPAKPKPQPPPAGTRGYHSKAQREQAVSKLLMTTEQLTDEERRIVQGYRISKRDLGMED